MSKISITLLLENNISVTIIEDKYDYEGIKFGQFDVGDANVCGIKEMAEQSDDFGNLVAMNPIKRIIVKRKRNMKRKDKGKFLKNQKELEFRNE